jgi:type IV secretory pathway VirB10-like protein
MNDAQNPHPDAVQEPAAQDNVRDKTLPPVAGLHYRNLGLAAAAVLVLLAVALFVTPIKRKEKPQEETRLDLPERTFLDSPPREPNEQTPGAALWQSLRHPTEGTTSDPEGPDQFRAWPEDQPADPLPVPPSPRDQALGRALKSATLRRANTAAALPGRTAESALTDPMLAAAAAVLPTPEAAAKLFSQGLPTGLSATGAAPVAEAGAVRGSLHTAEVYHAPTAAISPRLLRAGTLIPARLETAIDSDAPGPVTARVLRDVTDSATGQEVIIPAGALLLGSIGSQLAYGRDRAVVAFERLVVPGKTYELPGFEALEPTGTRGLPGKTSHHVLSSLGRAAMLALVGSGFELSQPDRGDRVQLAPGEVAASRMALELDRVASEILSRSLDRPPTVRIPATARFYVYLNRDLAL